MSINENFDWFKKNIKELKKKYKLTFDDYIVISKMSYKGKFNSYAEAYAYCEQNLKQDGYIIQKISDLDAKANTFGYIGFFL